MAEKRWRRCLLPPRWASDAEAPFDSQASKRGDGRGPRLRRRDRRLPRRPGLGRAGARVIGVDMTPEMIARARNNAVRGNFTNVEFRHGIIENLPVDDSSADVVVSNCVINLVPDKHAVFREVFACSSREGGLSSPTWFRPSSFRPGSGGIRGSGALCLGGAVPEERYVEMVRTAGFDPVEIVTREGLRLGPVHSVTVKAVKPEGSGK